MKLNIKYIILSVVILCIIIITTTFNIGKNNNSISENDFGSYTNAEQSIQNNQGGQAIAPLEILEKKYPDNSFITRSLGLGYASSGNYHLASSNFQRSLKLSPALQLDPVFMFQFGEILFFNREYKKAKVILERTLTLHGAGQFHGEIQNLLSKITVKG